MSTFIIKIIALLTMTIDHIGEFFPALEFSLLLRQIGRMSAVLFIFCVANGIKHTSNKLKYIERLYLASSIMGIGNGILMFIFQTSNIPISNNIFPTLMFIVMICTLDNLSKSDYKNYKKYSMLFIFSQILTFIIIIIFHSFDNQATNSIVNGVCPNIISCEGGIEFIFLGYLLYKFGDTKKGLAISYSAFCTFYFILAAVLGEFSYHNLFEENFQWLMIFSLPIMLLYNGRKGSKTKFSKYFFYLFYPLHIWLLFIASNIFEFYILP
ncbi:MAG: TraX family protein [Oscillospiraceae bacterium]